MKIFLNTQINEIERERERNKTDFIGKTLYDYDKTEAKHINCINTCNRA